MLRITGHRGFHLIFENGWTASVQFGPGNYCENYSSDFSAPEKLEWWESDDAEVAAWPRGGGLIDLGEGGVIGHLTANQVLAFLNWVNGDEHSSDNLRQALKVAAELSPQIKPKSLMKQTNGPNKEV